MSADSLLVTGLTAYTGTWDKTTAAHLLRRTTFGPKKTDIQNAVDLGLQGTINLLFSELPMPTEPFYQDFEADPNAALGESWVDEAFSDVDGLMWARFKSLQAWQMRIIYEEGISIREKLTLFWHNHFAVNRDGTYDARFLYKYSTTIRSAAWGDFKQLVKDITLDPLMLRFLNGRQNTASAPNENYARELLELFTIGKGPLAGPGDYTNYTEDDIAEIAKVLTGWRNHGFQTTDSTVAIEAYYTSSRHNQESKQLSNRFDNVIINNLEEEEYAHLIDIIFTKSEVARFIARKLYRWFVYYDIDDTVELNVIQPMATILIENDYEIRPALEALLKSDHFYGVLQVGPMIRNPLDFVFTILKSTHSTTPTNINSELIIWKYIFNKAIYMGMEYYFAPDVAGWPAYYQEPLFYRKWITTNSLLERSNFINRMTSYAFSSSGEKIELDLIEWISQFDNAMDPNDLIEEMIERLCPQPLATEQINALKEILIPGLPDYEWGVEYSEYLSDPTNTNKLNALKNKLNELLRTIFSMPEFYLS